MIQKTQLEALKRVTFLCGCCGQTLSLALYGGDDTCLLCKDSTNLNSKKNE